MHLPASSVGLIPLLLLWLVAGAGQSFVNLPTQTLIADRIPTDIQGRVYGAHFAWSHLWCAFSYPLAGWLGSHFVGQTFFYGSLIGLVLLVAMQFLLKPHSSDSVRLTNGFWHKHEHSHDEAHQHKHLLSVSTHQLHSHLHFHIAPHDLLQHNSQVNQD